MGLFKENYYGNDILEMLYIWAEYLKTFLLRFNLYYPKFFDFPY